MRRLREHQLVTMELERPPTSIECLVLAIDGGEATLEPVDPNQLVAVTESGTQALLTFEYRSQLISLRGTGRRDDVARDIRFAVTDRVTVPQRRRYARVRSHCRSSSPRCARKTAAWWTPATPLRRARAT